MRHCDGREQFKEVLERLSGEPLAAGFSKHDRALCGVNSPLRGFIADAGFATACLLSPFLESRHASILSLVETRRETCRGGIEEIPASSALAGPALAAHLAAIDGIDVVIAPASSTAAPTIDETDVGGGPGAEAAIQAITRFMRPINYLGLPVLEIPAGQSRHGLPIGLQLIGRPFGDEMAIALGRAFQIATNHHRRIPDFR
jgi:aspartyl-tRNA(Asn)/glutamyl-tRNA(Gln) amidotransferase subunit A